MKNPLQDYDTCHKCGGEGIFLENFFDGENFDYHYECSSEDCITNDERTHWVVTFELNPINRENDQ
jgi:hypothetical protein